MCNGDIDQSPALLFKEHFLDEIDGYLKEYPNTTVLLVPSVRDMMSDHASFPQSRMQITLPTDPVSKRLI